MHQVLRKVVFHPALSIAGVVLWGFIEFFALQRSRRAARRR